MKESFILFTEYKEQIDMLTAEQAGTLLKAIFCYTTDEPLPEMDPLTKMAFSFIRAALDRTDDKYQRRVESNRENGRLGGRPPKNKESEEENAQEKNPEKTQNNPNKTQKPNGYLGFEEKTQEETQKPNGFFQNPPEPEPVRDSEPERRVGDSARTREDTPLERFLVRWQVNSNAIGNYSGGRLSGIDWEKLSAKVERSSFLRQQKAIGFYIDHYADILDGKYDDIVRPQKKPDPDFDGLRFANIRYD